MSDPFLRQIDADTIAALSTHHFNPAILVRLDWPSGAVRVHTGQGDLTYDAQTWVGVGALGGLQMPAEEAGGGYDEAVFSLIVGDADTTQYLAEDYQNRAAQVWFGAVTEPGGNVLVGEPIRMLDARMSVLRERIEFTQENETAELLLTCQVGVPQRVPGSAYHTPEDQGSRFPGDTAGRLTLNAEAKANTVQW